MQNFAKTLLLSLTLLDGAAHGHEISADISPVKIEVDGFTVVTKQYLNQLQHEAFCYVSEEIFAVNQPQTSCSNDTENTTKVDPRALAREAANHPALMPVPDYVLNDEFRTYQPTTEDFRYQYESGDTELIIFKDTQLNKSEMQILDDFEAWLEKTGNSVPETFRMDNEMLRFYYTNGRNYEKALADMQDYIEYLYEFQIPVLEDAENQIPGLNEGWFYGYKRDKSGHPVFVIDLRVMMDLGVSVDELMESTVFLASYTQYHALVPGRIETWTLIVEAKDVSLSEFPVRSLFNIVQQLKRGYKQRIFNIVAINIHWLLKAAVDIVFTFVPPAVGEKIFFFGKDYKAHLDNLIGKDSLEMRFGGNLPDKKDDFFPPRYN